MIITLILTAINNISYADVLKGETEIIQMLGKMQLIVLRLILLAKLDL